MAPNASHDKEKHFFSGCKCAKTCSLIEMKVEIKYLLWPSNFRIINPRNVFCGATWPLLTGMFVRRISQHVLRCTSALYSPPSKSRSYSCRLCALPPLPRTIVDARRTLPTWNDLPTSPRSSLSRSYGRACEFLLGETRGVGEDCWSCVQFAEHFARRAAADADVLRGAVLGAHSGQWLICQREWRCSQEGLVPSTSGRDKSQPGALRMSVIGNMSSFGNLVSYNVARKARIWPSDTYNVKVRLHRW